MRSLRKPCIDRKGVYLGLQQRADGIVYQPMPRQRRQADEAGRGDPDVEMPAIARARVPGMRCAVVPDLQYGRLQRLDQGRTQLLDTRGRHGDGSLATDARRDSHRDCSSTKTSVAAVMPTTLKVTQVRSLALNATSRFAAPMTP